jgi:2-oxoglutarate dehydrogenase E1 component
MGAWNYIYPLLLEIMPKDHTLHYAGRARSATPATGSHLLHEKEHEMILKQVFENEN